MTHAIHTLWCHPRSVSTAFERIMRERGDCQAFHEPFMYYYYLEKIGQPYPGFDPDPDHPTSYQDLRDMILRAAQDGPVFHKDMAYYLVPEVLEDTELLDQMTHAILVRDPVQSIVSYAKITPDFSEEEVGHKAQWELYERLTQRGYNVHVISADTLRSDTDRVMERYWDFVGLAQKPEALNWDRKVPEGWETVASWHQNVLSSGGIVKPKTDNSAEKLAALGAPYTGYLDLHRPYYERLLELAE